MPSDLPAKVEISKNSLKSKIVAFFAILIAFLGFLVFVLEKLFSDYEPTEPISNSQVISQEPEYKGIVKYLPPEKYPDEKIGYELVDGERKRIILLKSKDDKLKMVENLDVAVEGVETKTLKGEPLLIVTKVTVSN